ncbi:MAG: 2Fe-2S iron-sulfur cluster binding domain-containing protein [Gammaproteobacteria bacterium]
MSFTISIADSTDSFTCDSGQNVLAAMEKLGRKGIPVGCRGGGCGICRVRVIGGAQIDRDYRTLKMSKAQVPDADREQGIALACKLLPLADIEVQPLGLLQKCLSSAAQFIQQSQRSG